GTGSSRFPGLTWRMYSAPAVEPKNKNTRRGFGAEETLFEDVLRAGSRVKNQKAQRSVARESLSATTALIGRSVSVRPGQDQTSYLDIPTVGKHPLTKGRECCHAPGCPGFATLGSSCTPCRQLGQDAERNQQRRRWESNPLRLFCRQVPFH